MKRLNPDYVAQVILSVDGSNFFKLISMRLAHLAWGECVLKLIAEEKHHQPFGMVHGGVCAALIDAACFWAVHTQLPEQAGMTTVDLKLNYLAPVIGGDLTANGRCVKLGRRLGLGTAEVCDAGGRIVAHGASTIMVLPELPMQNFSASLSKYQTDL